MPDSLPLNTDALSVLREAMTRQFPGQIALEVGS